MSYLSNELTTLLKKKGLQQVDIKKKTGLGVANVSRIFSGKQTYVRSPALDRIIDGLAGNPEEKARILRARLRDAYDGKYSDLVKIGIRGGASPSERFTPNDVSIDPDVNAAFRTLYSLVPRDPDLGPWLIQLSKRVDRKSE